MHINALTPPEQRVLGCLIEKRFTTPEQYPLSLNALRLAANQSTNRDPVVAYDEATVNTAAQRLSRYGLTRLASGHSSRATKYRHLAEEALGVQAPALALLGVLLLRGPQTPGELKLRTERMVAFSSLEEVDAALSGLAAQGYVTQLGRRPGQKEDRWAQRLGPAPDAAPSGEVSDAAAAQGASSPADQRSAVSPAAHPGSAPSPEPSRSAGSGATGDLEARVARLEAEVARLREALGG